MTILFIDLAIHLHLFLTSLNTNFYFHLLILIIISTSTRSYFNGHLKLTVSFCFCSVIILSHFTCFLKFFRIACICGFHLLNLKFIDIVFISQHLKFCLSQLHCLAQLLFFCFISAVSLGTFLT